MKNTIIIIILVLLLQQQHGRAQGMTTPWSEQAAQAVPLNDYPRPQLVRGHWENLNGQWDCAIVPKQQGRPLSWPYRITVPFPVEAPLSGVQRQVGPDSLLWYRRTFSVKENLAHRKVILHIGASDWETTVYLNGQKITTHQGGYTSFSMDVTPFLRHGQEELTVSVWDPTDQGKQPRGKQVRKPGGIYYTSVTGIWQTVWYEVVPESYITDYKVTADIDNSTVSIAADIAGARPQDSIQVRITLEGKQVSVITAPARGIVKAKVPHAQLWSPDHPVLYDLSIGLKRKHVLLDSIQGYFGMRKIEIARDEKGVRRIFLNHRPLFLYGPLDQGYWPDGIYTAPSEEALFSDIKRMKDMGFNMVRKHVKVEPARWYYHCDRIGLVVWQDMPSGYGEIVPVKDHDHSTEDNWLDTHYPDVQRSAASEADFRNEWSAIIRQLYNSPAIGVWVPFNESWGQFKTNEILRWTKSLDPTRLVDGPSGWIDRGQGDMRDYHLYSERLYKDFPLDSNRALVVGEFGGLGYLDPDHVYSHSAWSYNSLKSREAFLQTYTQLINRLMELKAKGFSAAVYTQLTDVETEINGILTYDRMQQKLDIDRLKKLHTQLYSGDTP